MTQKQPDNFCSVYVTFPSEEEAKEIARSAIDQKLAACANFIPSVTSLYRWDDNLCEDLEVLVFFKTTEAVYPKLESFIKQSHSYDVPCIVRLGIEAGNAEYLEWLKNTVL